MRWQEKGQEKGREGSRFNRKAERRRKEREKRRAGVSILLLFYNLAQFEKTRET